MLRDVVRPRAAYVAVLPDALGPSGPLPAGPGPQMVRMWVDRARFRPTRPTSGASCRSTSAS